MATTGVIVPRERIERYIFLIRGQKIMLSTHLADLYGVEPRALIQALILSPLSFPRPRPRRFSPATITFLFRSPMLAPGTLNHVKFAVAGR
jgi:hypothetical protein